MNAQRLHQLLLDAGIWHEDLSRLGGQVLVRVSEDIPLGGTSIHVVHEIRILTPDMAVTTSYAGWSGPVSARQARALALLAERYADALEAVTKVVDAYVEEVTQDMKEVTRA